MINGQIFNGNFVIYIDFAYSYDHQIPINFFLDNYIYQNNIVFIQDGSNFQPSARITVSYGIYGAVNLIINFANIINIVNCSLNISQEKQSILHLKRLLQLILIMIQIK